MLLSGLAVNQVQPGKLPLIADWPAEAQLKLEFGDNLVVIFTAASVDKSTHLAAFAWAIYNYQMNPLEEGRISKQFGGDMKNNDWKYLIGALLFVDICSIAVLGLLLAFVIPTGGGAGVSKSFMGLHRHDWGDIHLYLSLFMLALLILHIWLNWTWVINSTKSYFGDNWEKALWALSGAWIAVLILAYAIVKL